MKKTVLHTIMAMFVTTVLAIILIAVGFSWGWYLIAASVVLVTAGLVGGTFAYFGPLGLAYLRLRKLKNSPVPEARSEWLYDLLMVDQKLESISSKWRHARQDYGHLVYSLSYGLLEDIPFDARYQDWFGANSYELFRVILRDDSNRQNIAVILDRMMAANIQEYEKFYGYCESAGVEAALLSIEHDLPLDYAKELAA